MWWRTARWPKFIALGVLWLFCTGLMIYSWHKSYLMRVRHIESGEHNRATAFAVTVAQAAKVIDASGPLTLNALQDLLDGVCMESTVGMHGIAVKRSDGDVVAASGAAMALDLSDEARNAMADHSAFYNDIGAFTVTHAPAVDVMANYLQRGTYHIDVALESVEARWAKEDAWDDFLITSLLWSMLFVSSWVGVVHQHLLKSQGKNSAPGHVASNRA